MSLKGPAFYGEEFTVFKSGIDNIIEGMKRVLMTRIGERQGNPTFGSRLQAYVFSRPIEIMELQYILKQDLDKWTRGITINSITVETKENSPNPTKIGDFIAQITINFTDDGDGEVYAYNLAL